MTAGPVVGGVRSPEHTPLRRVRNQFLTGVALGLAALPLALLLLVAADQVRLAHVTSGSMGRAAPVDALVVGRPVVPDAVRVGDVITFTAPTGGRPSVTHRVAAVAGVPGDRVLQTRGDANASSDPWLLGAGDGPLWRSVLVVPGVGSVLASPARLLVLALLGAGPLLAVVALLRALWRPALRSAT